MDLGIDSRQAILDYIYSLIGKPNRLFYSNLLRSNEWHQLKNNFNIPENILSLYYYVATTLLIRQWWVFDRNLYYVKLISFDFLLNEYVIVIIAIAASLNYLEFKKSII